MILDRIFLSFCTLVMMRWVKIQPLAEKQGLIAYGSTTIDQRVRIANRNVDYMTTWKQWLDVQNGANLRTGRPYEGNTR